MDNLKLEFSVVLFQIMFSRSAHVRVAKQQQFVSRCHRRLQDAQTKMNEAQIYLETCENQVQELHGELEQAESLLEDFAE